MRHAALNRHQLTSDHSTKRATSRQLAARAWRMTADRHSKAQILRGELDSLGFYRLWPSGSKPGHQLPSLQSEGTHASKLACLCARFDSYTEVAPARQQQVMIAVREGLQVEYPMKRCDINESQQ